MQDLDNGSRLTLAGPRLDGQRSLARRGRQKIGVEYRVRRLELESLQASARQHDRVVLAIRELPQPRFDVAANGEVLEIRPHAAQEGHATGAAGANPRAARQILQALDQHC